MLTIVSSNSWQSLVAARRLRALRLALGPTPTETRSLGNAVPREALLLGAAATKIVTTTMVVVAVAAAAVAVVVLEVVVAARVVVLLLGLVIVVSGTMTTMEVTVTTAVNKTTVMEEVPEAPLLLELHLGTKRLLLLPGLSRTVATPAAILDFPRWVLLRDSEGPRVPVWERPRRPRLTT